MPVSGLIPVDPLFWAQNLPTFRAIIALQFEILARARISYKAMFWARDSKLSGSKWVPECPPFGAVGDPSWAPPRFSLGPANHYICQTSQQVVCANLHTRLHFGAQLLETFRDLKSTCVDLMRRSCDIQYFYDLILQGDSLKLISTLRTSNVDNDCHSNRPERQPSQWK